jgi:hypothetical protein
MKPLPPRQQNAPGTNLALLKKAFEHEQFPIWSQAWAETLLVNAINAAAAAAI